jgi:5,10-methylenetetrahydromethanopterin reductase
LDPSGVALGAYVPVFVHPDRDMARSLISGGVASYARFSAMHGRVVGPIDDEQRRVLHSVHDSYDMDQHFTHGSAQSGPLTDQVIDAFGVAGPAAYCIDRLQALAELGLSKLFVMPGGIGVERHEASMARRRLVDEVLPALR